MLGVVVLGILQGILIAVVLALGDLIRGAARPHDAVLGERPGGAGFHDIERYEDAETLPGLVIYRFDAPFFFANAEAVSFPYVPRRSRSTWKAHAPNRRPAAPRASSTTVRCSRKLAPR